MRELVKYKEKFIDKIRGFFNKIFGKNTKVEKLSKEKCMISCIFYPKATSSAIIKVNPDANITTPILE